MLRICLIIAVAAGLAGLYGAYSTGEKLKATISERDEHKQSAETARSNETKAKGEAKKAKDEADKAKNELAKTSEELKTTSEKAVAQETRANDLTEKFAKSETGRVKAERDISAWQALGYSVEQIRLLPGALREATNTIAVYADKKRVLTRRLNIAENALAIIKGPNREVSLPPELKGKIVAVDPKYDFVVLDIGSKDNLLQGGKLAVSRAGKLVARLKVTNVEANRAIANVMPEWKQDEVMEGDSVFPSYEALAQP